MNDIYLLSCALVAAGLYIVYLHGVIRQYARWAYMARTALHMAHDCLVEKRDSNEADT